MSAIDDLRRLFNDNQPVSGRAVSVTGSGVRVATRSGIVEASHDGTLMVGDVVVIQAGLAVKKQRGDAPVFFV